MGLDVLRTGRAEMAGTGPGQQAHWGMGSGVEERERTLSSLFL